MRTRIATAIAATVLVSLAVAAAPAAAKTAKACTKEWQADKVAMQAAGKTEKAYVAECRTAAAPPTVAGAPAAKPESPKFDEQFVMGRVRSRALARCAQDRCPMAANRRCEERIYEAISLIRFDKFHFARRRLRNGSSADASYACRIGLSHPIFSGRRARSTSPLPAY